MSKTVKGLKNYFQKKDYKYPKMFYEGNNTSTIEFMGEPFNIPSPPEKFIEYAYGKNWNIPNKSQRITNIPKKSDE